MSLEDSAHWPASHNAYGGVAVSSLDMRRVMQAAAVRKPKLNWVSRWLFRSMVRARIWQHRAEGMRARASQTAAKPSVGHPGGEAAKP